MHMNNTYTAESVTSGHPDKVCDEISDAILDAYLEKDPYSRVAVETFGSHNLLVVGGEVTSKGKIDAGEIARNVYKDIGYSDNLNIITNIVQQSPDIAQGVDTGGAGDQGIMYGYATDETKEFLPLAVSLVHKLTKGLENLRRNDKDFYWLGPDGKAQVTITYGGMFPHGGGAFSGKDPTKVDRSAAYMSRFVAKNLVANGFAKNCLVSVAYAIGRAEPLMVYAEDEKGKDLSGFVKVAFDFRPQAIIEKLNLRRPIYFQTASYGHFGKEGLPWEEIISL